MATDHTPLALICQLMDGSRIRMHRDEGDRLVVIGFEPSAGHKAGEPPLGAVAVGFGPWPSWDANVRNGVDTRPDEESGLFEPERLFVLREQYMFLQPTGSSGWPMSFGPLHKVWWDGTEHVVQARQRSARH